MVLTDHFSGVSRGPHLHMDTWCCCGCCLRCSVVPAQLELPASSWYLAADGSLSMLADTRQYLPDTFSICLIPSVSCHPRCSDGLELRLLCCNGCQDISIPMHALQDFQHPFSGIQPPLGKGGVPCGLEHPKIFSCLCTPLLCTWFLPAPQGYWLCILEACLWKHVSCLTQTWLWWRKEGGIFPLSINPSSCVCFGPIFLEE